MDKKELFHFINFFPFQYGSPSIWLKQVKKMVKSNFFPVLVLLLVGFGCASAFPCLIFVYIQNYKQYERTTLIFILKNNLRPINSYFELTRCRLVEHDQKYQLDDLSHKCLLLGLGSAAFAALIQVPIFASLETGRHQQRYELQIKV